LETPDRELFERHVERVTLRSHELEIVLRGDAVCDDADALFADAPLRLSIPFVPNLPRRKGIAHAPADNRQTIDPETRNALLRAIARSRGWLDSILSGRAASFDEIAAAENLVERHVRFLTPLAFLSPRIINAIADGAVPIGLTVSTLARALPHKWIDQEQLLGLGRDALV
jgi:hypothetical protein